MHLQLCASAEWAETVERYIIPWVLEGADLGEDVIEIGPGPGRTTEVLRNLAPHLTAVEVDAGLAEALSVRMADSNVEVLHADATQLPLPDGRFSAALSFTMLHHVPSVALQDRLFAEVARVLRPRGLLAGIDSLDGDEFRELHRGDICVPVEPDGLSGRLAGVGFRDVRVDTNDYAVRFRATAPVPAS